MNTSSQRCQQRTIEESSKVAQFGRILHFMGTKTDNKFKLMVLEIWVSHNKLLYKNKSPIDHRSLHMKRISNFQKIILVYQCPGPKNDF